MITTPHETPQSRQGAHLFRHLQPDLVLDIGANVGESMRWFREIWPDTPVWSFEPRREAYEVLAKATKEPCKALCFALSDIEHPATMRMNVYTGSDGAGGGSSLLSTTELMKQTRPWARSSSDEDIACLKLDYIGEYFPIHSLSSFERIFVKIDVQGYEAHVIRGGMQTFTEKVIGAFVEVEAEPLYEEAATFDEVDGLLRSCGLECVGAAQKVHRGSVFSWADWVWLRK